MYHMYGKRLLDLTLTIPALILLSPLLLLLWLLVRVKLGAPAIFRQERAGQHGQPFIVLKFRSMTDDRDAAGNLLPDPQRITDFGRFLRSTSLDELPQLFNVLRGEMSIIGPRPLPMRYLDRYTPEQNKRHEIKPGLACWAVLHGRSNQTWDQILTHDVWYVRHYNVWLDLQIIFRTLMVVIKREGVERSAEGCIAEFMGVLQRGQPEYLEAPLVRLQHDGPEAHVPLPLHVAQR